MGYYTDTDSRRNGGTFPAFGPIDSLLGFVVFYIFVDRATTTITEVFSTLTGLPESAIGLGIAGLLWFILGVTLLDIGRRQFAAIGVGSHDSIDETDRQRGVPTEFRALLYLGVVVVGGVIAWWTFEPAVAMGIELIQIAGTLDTSAFDLVGFVLMVLFFVSFGAATRAFDRLVIGGARAILSG